MKTVTLNAGAKGGDRDEIVSINGDVLFRMNREEIIDSINKVTANVLSVVLARHGLAIYIDTLLQ